MKKSIALFAVIMGISSITYGATLQSLDKEKVTKLFEDRTMTTISMVTLNNKLANNTLTAYIGKDGRIIGQLANKPHDIPQGDKGTWMVKEDGALCVTWEHWQGGKQTCVDVFETRNMLVFLNTITGKFESAALVDFFKDGDQMN